MPSLKWLRLTFTKELHTIPDGKSSLHVMHKSTLAEHSPAHLHHGVL
jgi:hypothetical protein